MTQDRSGRRRIGLEMVSGPFVNLGAGCLSMRKLLIAGSILAASLLPTTHAQAAACSVLDVSLTIGLTPYQSTRCADNVANGSSTVETAAMNAALGTSGLTFLAKSDGTSSTTGLGGIKFTVTAPSAGSWNISWTDTNSSQPLNLPINVNFEVGLFGGSNGAVYWLSNLLLPSSPNSGTDSFNISFTNNGGQHPGLSHLTLIGEDPPLAGVPEPASAALLSMGMIGTGVVARRRRQHASTLASA